MQPATKSREKPDLGKVFSLYLDQQVMTPDGQARLVFVGICGSEEQRIGTLRPLMSAIKGYKFSEVKLILRTLHQMTDEEALQIAMMTGRTELLEKHGKVCFSLLSNYISDMLPFEVVQYLLQQGFSIPLYELKGQTSIECGIAIKKQKQHESEFGVPFDEDLTNKDY